MANYQTKVWRSDYVPPKKVSRYERLNINTFVSHVEMCSFDRRVKWIDQFGQENILHVYVEDHARRNLRARAASDYNPLMVEWFKEAICYPEILEEILMAEDCDKFMVLDRDWGRIITFSVLPQHEEYMVLVQSVFFLAQNNYGKFFVGSEDIRCFSIGRSKELLIGVDNIDEMEHY